jgi:cytochrome P450
VDDAHQRLESRFKPFCDRLRGSLYCLILIFDTKLLTYPIAALPDVRTKLLAEIDALDNPADPMTISRLPYLTAVCQETLRLYPIAINAFPRVVKEPMDILGYALESGTVIMPSIYLAHHRPSVYPEPKQFRPERFLERQFSPYEYLPFGGGDRRCIGSAFALFEMKIVLFELLSNLELTLVNTKSIAPTRRGLTLAPSNRLQLKVIGSRRSAPIPSVVHQ